MKNRVTVFLEDIPYRALKVMSASEGKTMSDLIEEFVMGVRQNISDPKEQEKILAEHGLEVDDPRAHRVPSDTDTSKKSGGTDEVSYKGEICKHGRKKGLCEYGCK